MNHMLNCSPYSSHPIEISHSNGLTSCILHSFPSKKMHCPYGLPNTLGLNRFVLNLSTSSKNSFLVSSFVFPKKWAIFARSSSANIPLPSLHPMVHALQPHGCANFITSLSGVSLLRFIILFAVQPIWYLLP